MFVELGGFVNNAFSMSPSVCLLASVHSHTRNFYLWVCLFFLIECLWIGVIRHVIACQHPCSFISHVHRWTAGFMDTLAANYIAPVHGRGLLPAFHSPLYSCDGVVTEKWGGGAED